jgi:2-pyrone-4,6-dicarboxylate lactonase
MMQTSKSTLHLPKNACDTHVHVFGPYDRFPFPLAHQNKPAEAPKEKLFALHQQLGVTRCVIVQSMVHGLDNAVVEDAISAGAGNYLGVALVKPDVDHIELKRLAAAGFRATYTKYSMYLGNSSSSTASADGSKS